MTLGEVFRTLRTFWWVTVLGLLVGTGAAGAVAVLVVPPTWSSTGYSVLVHPRQFGDKPTDTNPLLNFDASLSTTGLVLTRTLDPPEVDDDDIAARMGLPAGDRFTVRNGASTDAGDSVVQPFLLITSRTRTEEGSIAAVNRVLAAAQQILADNQRSLRVSTQNQVTMRTIGDPTPPKQVWTSTIAASAAALLFCLCLTLITTLLLGVLTRRRRERRARAREEQRMRHSPPVAGTGDRVVV